MRSSTDGVMMKERRDVLALGDPLRAARVAQRSARYDTALELLDGCEDWSDDLAEKAALLKAETLGRRDPSEALAYLTSIDDLFVSAEGRFGRDIECGRLHSAVRDFTSAESRYADARVVAGAAQPGRRPRLPCAPAGTATAWRRSQAPRAP